jgi:hypothetical protein
MCEMGRGPGRSSNDVRVFPRAATITTRDEPLLSPEDQASGGGLGPTGPDESR